MTGFALAAPTRGPDGSLLLPLDGGAALLASLPRTARAPDGTPLVRKHELHVTAWGSRVGQAIRKAAPDLPLEALVPSPPRHAAWGAPLLHLVRVTPDGARLATLVRAVDAPLDALRAHAARVLGAAAPAGLGAPAWPHVTLYTSDPAGHAGIGVPDLAVLWAALARGVTEPGTGLGAVYVGG